MLELFIVGLISTVIGEITYLATLSGIGFIFMGIALYRIDKWK
jgi:hypothetical protein